jgi:hypothetical protein
VGGSIKGLSLWSFGLAENKNLQIRVYATESKYLAAQVGLGQAQIEMACLPARPELFMGL